MGKPFNKELERIEATYSWAKTVDVGGLVEFVKRTRELPLLNIGSGGSLTTAAFSTALHQEIGALSDFSTPLDAMQSNYDMHDVAALFATAKGRHHDTIACLRNATDRQLRNALVLCASVNTPVVRLARRFGFEVFDFELPTGSDGFLAVNSIIASATLLTRAYYEAAGLPTSLPATLSTTVEGGVKSERGPSEFAEVLERDTFFVLYGKWGKPAAFDLESKLSEAALANVIVSDYRNFAHGRHHWFAKRSDTSAIISLATPEEEELANRTIGLIPQTVSRIRFSTREAGPVAGLALLAKVMTLVGLIGESRGVDPGRPGVPAFGSRIYHLRTKSRFSSPFEVNAPNHAVQAKMRLVKTIPQERKTDYWQMALQQYISRLERGVFGGIVFDYDGTLCDPLGRFSGISDNMAKELVSILRHGIVLGVATGRGGSVRDSLRHEIPEAYWSRVLIGYYNGSDVGSLSENNHPDKTKPLAAVLESFLKELDRYKDILGNIGVNPRPGQISLEPEIGVNSSELFLLLSDVVARNPSWGLRIVISSHSIDILAPSVSKLSLVQAVRNDMTRSSSPGKAVLCIGDKGGWPGNDFEFLHETFSLSVDEVSADPQTCWNLAPAGCRGVVATILYLRALELGKKYFRFKHARLKQTIER